jgi:hypothetical protein
LIRERRRRKCQDEPEDAAAESAHPDDLKGHAGDYVPPWRVSHFG